MRKIIFSLFILLCISDFAYSTPAKMPALMPYNPYTPPSQIIKENGDVISEYPKLNLAEKKVFGRVFTNEDILNRLNRLEKKLFNRNFSNLSLAQRTDNIINQVGIEQLTTISQRELSIMEQRIFMKTYPYDDIEMRITRLEKEVFGAMQGGEIEERYKTLKNATKYYNAFPPKLSNQIPYYSNPYHEAWQGQKVTLPSIMKNIGNFFKEPTITGFSPDIVYPNNIPYGFSNNFGSPYGMQRNFSGPGYRFNQAKHFGQGASVNILQN